MVNMSPFLDLTSQPSGALITSILSWSFLFLSSEAARPNAATNATNNVNLNMTPRQITQQHWMDEEGRHETATMLRRRRHCSVFVFAVQRERDERFESHRSGGDWMKCARDCVCGLLWSRRSRSANWAKVKREMV